VHVPDESGELRDLLSEHGVELGGVLFDEIGLQEDRGGVTAAVEGGLG
jgi:hypothetical protein